MKKQGRNRGAKWGTKQGREVVIKQDRNRTGVGD